MDIYSILNDFSNSWENDNNSVDCRKNHSGNYSNNYGNNYGDSYDNNYDSNYRSNYKSNYKSQQKRQDTVDGLLEPQLACLTIGETGGADDDGCSTAPDEPAPTSSPNTVQEAPKKSPEEPISPEFGFSDEPKSQFSTEKFGHLLQSPSSSSDFESPDDTSCTIPEPDSDNDADGLEIRPTRLPDSDIFVKPNIPKELRLLVDDSEKDDIDEQNARVRSALRRTGTRQVKGDWSSMLPPPYLRQSRSKSKKAKADGSLMACPYTKHDNATQEQLYRCRRMAFQDTHRLKEHLYRVHRQKPHCTRCGEIFALKADLEPHSRLQEVCNLAEAIHVEGFTSAQEDELKSKKRKRNLKTEEDKWANIFRILFPTCTKMPDPCTFSPFLNAVAFHRCMLETDQQTSDYRLTSDDHLKDFTMDQSDVESIFADDVPSELEERTFSRLEAISGRLDDEQRQEVKSIFKDFTSERVRQITEKTDSVSENAETTGPRGVPSPEKSLHKNAVSDETFIAIADPIGLEGRILSVLEPEPVHENVPSHQGLPGAPPEPENDMLEKALAAWNEAAVQGWDCGLTKGNGLNGLVGPSHVTQSDVSNLLFDFNFIDDFQVAVDDNHPAFNPFGGLPSWQGA